jgi:hypothetical protein
MLAIRAYLLVDYQVNAEATPDSIPPTHGTRPRPATGAIYGEGESRSDHKTAPFLFRAQPYEVRIFGKREGAGRGVAAAGLARRRVTPTRRRAFVRLYCAGVLRM